MPEPPAVGGLPDVTVVIPTKDRPVMLGEALGTVLGQEGVEVRVVVVDDGSAVPLSVAQVQALRDHRVTVLRNPHPTGVSAARNRGLAAASTPWVAFLDDDDVWAPRKLRRQLDAVSASGYRWACSASVSFTERELLDVLDPPEDDDVLRVLLRGNQIPGGGSGVLASTDLVRAVGGFDEALSSLADWDCWVRLADASPLARVAAPDVGYRVHAGGMAHDVRRMERELSRMRDTLAQREPPLRLVPDAHFRAYLARQAYRGGDMRDALKRTAQLLVDDRRPSALLTPARHALPDSAQRWLRARRLAARARRRPDQDWSWVAGHLGPATAVTAPRSTSPRGGGR